jgi:hypothetical protein
LGRKNVLFPLPSIWTIIGTHIFTKLMRTVVTKLRLSEMKILVENFG